MTARLLQAGAVFRVVGKLRKHSDEAVSAASLEIVDRWKGVLGEPTPHEGTELAAYILIARRGLNAILDCGGGGGGDCVGGGATADDFYHEQIQLEKDSKALMYGRVVDKHARHNLCFGEVSQQPDYASGRGTVVSFAQVPLLDRIRTVLGEVLGECGAALKAEGNYYYDPSKCGIGYHGDSERRKVVGVRVGEAMPLHMTWFHNSKPCSSTHMFQLEHGDVYMFSEKATGCDWKKKVVPTLRHAAGAAKFLKLKE